MKEPVHESIADGVKYIYFKITGKKRQEKDNVVLSKTDWNSMLPSFHKAREFWAVLSGRYMVWINGEKIELAKGDILFIDSYKTHYYTEILNSSKIDLVFDESFLSNIVGEGKGFPLLIKNKEVYDEVVRLSNEVDEKWETMESIQKIGFVHRILGLMIENVNLLVYDEGRKADTFAKKIIEYLFQHYDEDINIKTLSSKFGYTEGYFSELFNKVMGMNLREYVNRLRITIADNIKKENPNITLSKIAERVGYNSWVTFYRAYNRYSTNKPKS